MPGRWDGRDVSPDLSVLAGEKIFVPPDVRPESSWTITHLAISSAPDMMPPAGLTLSLRKGATGRTVSLTSACGVATSPSSLPPDRTMSLLVMPTFEKIRVRMKSSQVVPDTASMTSPATR